MQTSTTITITQDGAKLAIYCYAPDGYETSTNAKTPLLCLHGNGSSHDSFLQIADIFAEERLVVVPDMRAQGVSTRGNEHLTYELLAQDALCILDALNIERAVVLGSSDGAIEALLMARDAQDRVAGLVAMGANLTPEGVLEDEDFTAMTLLDKSFYAELATELNRAQEALDLLVLMDEEPNIAAESLGAISCPATIMAGEFDLIDPVQTDEIAAAIPGAKKLIVPEASHSLMRDALDTVAAEVAALFAGID